MMTRAEVLRKCLIVFDALRRVSSKGNAGLEALPGAEESFRADAEICKVLREWLREMEAGAAAEETMRMAQYLGGKVILPQGLEGMLQGNPLMTQETIEAARALDEIREKIISQAGQPEPNAPKVVDLKEWQRLKTPPERLDFDE